MRFSTPILAVALAVCPAVTCALAMDERDVAQVIAQQLVPNLMGQDAVGGVAVAVRIGGRTLFYTHGLADVANRRPVTSDSLFNIASLRKVCEAIVLAQAVQRGELKLDDPVARYVTELDHGGKIREVTLGQLASHTSGLLLPTDRSMVTRLRVSSVRSTAGCRSRATALGKRTPTPMPAIYCCNSRWSAGSAYRSVG